MSVQAQMREWVDDAVKAVLGPLFDRVDKLEAYVKSFEQTNHIPEDPAPRRGSTSKAEAKPSAGTRSSAHDRPAAVAKAAPASGRGSSSTAK
jgi:hypothetical protein